MRCLGEVKEVFFFGGQVLEDGGAGVVGDDLNLFFESFRFVFGQFGFFHGVVAVVPRLTDTDFAVFGVAVSNFDEFVASFATHLGKRNANKGAINIGIQTNIGGLNAFGYRLKKTFIPRLDDDHAGIRGGDRGAIFNAHLRSVGVYMDVFDHRRGRFPGVNIIKLMERVVHGFFHFGFGIGDDGM